MTPEGSVQMVFVNLYTMTKGAAYLVVSAGGYSEFIPVSQAKPLSLLGSQANQ